MSDFHINFFTPQETFRRREKLCLGYWVDYDSERQIYQVSIFGVQNGRIPSVLGELLLSHVEWSVFFGHVYGRWERLADPTTSAWTPEPDTTPDTPE
jgi:hypothetical protein